MIAEHIKALRDKAGLTQTQLARKLGVTRSCVNAWEMGISSPSTQYLVDLAILFHVSTDYLLGFRTSAVISVDGLEEEDIALLHDMIAHLRKLRQK